MRLSRETGGRFAEANLDSDIDKDAALRWFLARYPESVGVGYHTSVPADWALQWETRPHLSTANQPVSDAGGERTRVLHPRHAGHVAVATCGTRRRTTTSTRSARSG